ncbi:MAG: MFS transporter [Clostridia bacterium]|nr:MFS transporter [Clostridia bacterium]
MSEVQQSRDVTQRDPYSSTRRLYKWEALFEYLCTILSTGGFMTKVSLTLGVRDSITALIGTTASLACVFSMVSGHMQRYTPIKRWLLPLAFLTRFCMVAMYLLPFVKMQSGVDVVLFALVFVTQATSSVIVPAKQNMFLTPVREENRTAHLAVVNMLSLLLGIPLFLFGGSFLDYMEARGQIKQAFLIVAGVILLFCICHMLTLIFSKEPTFEKNEHKSVFGDIGALFRNRKFRFFLITNLVHNIAQGVLTPYLATYAQKDFGFSMMVFGMFNAIQMLLGTIGFFFVRIFGKRLPPTTLRTIFFVAYIFYDFFWLLMTKETAFAWHFPVVLAGGAINVANIAYTVLLFSIVDEKERTSALAFMSALMGLCTFLTNLFITPFFDMMQENGVTLFGAPAYPQQILGIVSVGLRLLALTLWLFEKKQYKTKI